MEGSEDEDCHEQVRVGGFQPTHHFAVSELPSVVRGYPPAILQAYTLVRQWCDLAVKSVNDALVVLCHPADVTCGFLYRAQQVLSFLGSSVRKCSKTHISASI